MNNLNSMAIMGTPEINKLPSIRRISSFICWEISLFLEGIKAFSGIRQKRFPNQSKREYIKKWPIARPQKPDIAKEDDLDAFNGHSQRQSSCYGRQLKSLRGAVAQERTDTAEVLCWDTMR
ncbi:hypothetical protein CEXT_703201 [Caerostris extrusa]|uniref:Uncharacterized protein n=1 Tax=Caerostris extrusa TaxID=172846 RepID=A0AAV4TR40_CAEEX|nr:hypothetical protein CEXT_703201 [Caerostris extrusa]